MAATRALVTKELRQHSPALAGVTVLLAVTWAASAATLARQVRVLSELELVSTFALVPLLGAALFLGHRLVVKEYLERTQRFVEALPVRRHQMALIKLIFGLLWLELWAAGALLGSVAHGATPEPIGARFLTILGARLGVYVFCVWSVVFLFGILGRLRIPLAGVLAILLGLLDQYTPWQMRSFGPFALMSHETFPFERALFPVKALVQAGFVGVVALALAALLLLVREGSIVESLARRLSSRERTAILVIGAGAAVTFGAVHREPTPQPYAFTMDKVLRGQSGVVEIAYVEDELRPAAERIAAELEPTLGSVADTLGWPRPLPPVRLVHGPEVPLHHARTVYNQPEHGLVLRVNLADESARARTEIIGNVVHQLIVARTRRRAMIEPRHWVLDGFALEAALHRGQASPPAFVHADAIMVRAVAATELVALDTSALRAYQMTAERLGDELTASLAASGWRVLEARVGHERAQALARAVLTRAATSDFRDPLHEWRFPLPTLLETTAGITWDQLMGAWREELAAWRARPATQALLQELPRGDLAVRASAARVGVDGKLAGPLAAATSCTLLHRRLPPYDAAFSSDELEEVAFLSPRGTTDLSRAVEGIYGRGERVFVALDCEVENLDCSTRLVAARVTVP